MIKNNIAIVYGSTTGNIENAAESIADLFEDDQVELFDVAEDIINLDDFNIVIFGISTWEFGGLQEDWIEYFPFFEDLELGNKICALFGHGDQNGYDEWFQDALKDVHDVLEEKNAIISGYWTNSGYDFTASRGLTADGNYFLGLALDDDNQPELTDERIEQWVAELKISISELQAELAPNLETA